MKRSTPAPSLVPLRSGAGVPRSAAAAVASLVLSALLVAGMGTSALAQSAPGAAQGRAGIIPMRGRPHSVQATLLRFGGGIHGIGVTTGAPKVYLVYWGTQWGTASINGSGYTQFSGDSLGFAPDQQAFFKGLGTGSELWDGVMTQYCEGVSTGATTCPSNVAHVGYPTGGALAGVWYDNSAAAPAAASQAQIAAEGVATAAHFGNTTAASNRNAQYVVTSPPGANPDHYKTGGFCAWHFYTTSSYGDIAYTNMPFLTDVGQSCGQNFVNSGSGGTLDGVTIVGGHEYAETITDQDPAGGWTDTSGAENGDKCAWIRSGQGAAANLVLTTGSFAVQSTWANDFNGGAGGCLQSHSIFGGGKQDQTITFGPIPNHTYGDADFVVTATASSGLTVTFTASGNCTVTVATVHITGAGSCTITAHQAGDGNYNPAPDVAQSFSIAKANQTISFTVADHTYGDPDFTISASASSGLAVSFTLVSGNCTLSGSTVHISGAGNCSIKASQGGDANYNAAPDVTDTFNIFKADQTITFAPLPDRTYGDADFTVSATSSSGLPVSFGAAGQCTVSGTTVHLTGAGSCSITAHQGGDSNYDPASDVVQGFSIAKSDQTISFGALADRTYGDADFTVSASASSGLAVSFLASGQCTVTGATVHLTGAGSCTITAQQAGDSNYSAAPDVAQGFAVGSRATATKLKVAPKKSHQGGTVKFTATVTSVPAGPMPTGVVDFTVQGVFVGEVVVGPDGVAVLSYPVTQGRGVYPVVATFANLDGNFFGSVSGTRKLTIR